MPDTRLLEEMGKFNEELVKAGDHAGRRGAAPELEGRARPVQRRQARTVIDGPFAETKELVAGFWIWQVKSLRRGDRVGEALPEPASPAKAEIEIRQVFEAEDFGAAFTPELREAEERLRAKIADNAQR